jgi:hypothetical protein
MSAGIDIAISADTVDITTSTSTKLNPRLFTAEHITQNSTLITKN